MSNEQSTIVCELGERLSRDSGKLASTVLYIVAWYYLSVLPSHAVATVQYSTVQYSTVQYSTVQ